MCVTDRHDMTLATKLALNLNTKPINTNNQLTVYLFFYNNHNSGSNCFLWVFMEKLFIYMKETTFVHIADPGKGCGCKHFTTLTYI